MSKLRSLSTIEPLRPEFEFTPTPKIRLPVCVSSTVIRTSLYSVSLSGSRTVTVGRTPSPVALKMPRRFRFFSAMAEVGVAEHLARIERDLPQDDVLPGHVVADDDDLPDLAKGVPALQVDIDFAAPLRVGRVKGLLADRVAVPAETLVVLERFNVGLDLRFVVDVAFFDLHEADTALPWDRPCCLQE